MIRGLKLKQTTLRLKKEPITFIKKGLLERKARDLVRNETKPFWIKSKKWVKLPPLFKAHNFSNWEVLGSNPNGILSFIQENDIKTYLLRVSFFPEKVWLKNLYTILIFYQFYQYNWNDKIRTNARRRPLYLFHIVCLFVCLHPKFQMLILLAWCINKLSNNPFSEYSAMKLLKLKKNCEFVNKF